MQLLTAYKGSLGSTEARTNSYPTAVSSRGIFRRGREDTKSQKWGEIRQTRAIRKSRLRDLDEPASSLDYGSNRYEMGLLVFTEETMLIDASFVVVDVHFQHI